MFMSAVNGELGKAQLKPAHMSGLFNLFVRSAQSYIRQLDACVILLMTAVYYSPISLNGMKLCFA